MKLIVLALVLFGTAYGQDLEARLAELERRVELLERDKEVTVSKVTVSKKPVGTKVEVKEEAEYRQVGSIKLISSKRIEMPSVDTKVVTENYLLSLFDEAKQVNDKWSGMTSVQRQQAMDAHASKANNILLTIPVKIADVRAAGSNGVVSVAIMYSGVLKKGVVQMSAQADADDPRWVGLDKGDVVTVHLYIRTCFTPRTMTWLPPAARGSSGPSYSAQAYKSSIFLADETTKTVEDKPVASKGPGEKPAKLEAKWFIHVHGGGTLEVAERAPVDDGGSYRFVTTTGSAVVLRRDRFTVEDLSTGLKFEYSEKEGKFVQLDGGK
jgi:hypothetical protein